MMAQTLADSDLEFVRQTLRGAMAPERADAPGQNPQALGGVGEILLLHALIPVLVSLTSSVLTEVIKRRALSSLTQAEAQDAVGTLRLRPVVPRMKLEEDSLGALRRALGPMGHKDEDFQRMYAVILQHVASDRE
jgi:hypothetical protein